jgi:CRP-like cAMP-binding protein
MANRDEYEELHATWGITPTAQQRAFIESLVRQREYEKGEFYQRAGEICTHGALVVRGCFRSFLIDEEGREHIVTFYAERGWIGDIESARTRNPTPYYLEALEPSTVLAISLASFDQLLSAIPEIARGYQLGLERGNAARERRIVLSLQGSAEERYAEFLRRHPSLAQRVPQRMLASYLGMTPETLSRIRRKAGVAERS